MMNWRKGLHNGHAVLFMTLLASGFSLHFAILRGPLAAWRMYLMKIHAVAGELFCLVITVYFLYLLFLRSSFWQKEGRRPGLICAGFLAMSVVAGTGLILLNKAGFGPVMTSRSFEVHHWLAYLSVPAVLRHLWVIWTKALPEAVPSNRRRFFGWLAGGLGTAWAASVGWRLLAGTRTPDVRGTDNCDVFFPQPEPSPGSMPPIGGGMNGTFGEYSAMNFLPCLNHETWQLSIDGLVNRPVTFSWDEFVRLPRTVQVSDFHCVEGWSVFNITYEGLFVSDLLKIAGIRPEAKFVKFYSADGQYADTLSLEQAHMPDVMIVLMMDGTPIPRVLGGPARLIVPRMYAYKAVKWVSRIELINEPYLGYWEWYGYDTDAWVKQ